MAVSHQERAKSHEFYDLQPMFDDDDRPPMIVGGGGFMPGDAERIARTINRREFDHPVVVQPIGEIVVEHLHDGSRDATAA